MHLLETFTLFIIIEMTSYLSKFPKFLEEYRPLNILISKYFI